MSEGRKPYQHAIVALRLAIKDESDRQSALKSDPEGFKQHIAESEIRVAECAAAITLLEDQA